MSSVEFIPNPNLEAELSAMIQSAAIRGFQPAADLVYDECNGWSVEDIKPIFSARWAEVSGGSISDPHLTYAATEISEGRRVSVAVLLSM